MRVQEAAATEFGYRGEGEPAPEGWREWLGTLFPSYVEHPMAEHHDEFWEHIWSTRVDSAPRSFCSILPRGGGKTTTAELACTALGVSGSRRYAWYVSETQDKADKNIENIAVQLESEQIERYYPRHANRKVGKYGASRGWRKNRLRTAGGFTIDAVGLDTAARRLKVEEQRPNLIVLDDVDGCRWLRRQPRAASGPRGVRRADRPRCCGSGTASGRSIPSLPAIMTTTYVARRSLTADPKVPQCAARWPR